MNGLKKINDTYGHLAGDEAITTVSSSIFKVTKLKQSVFRIGGDEFIIICKKTSEEELLNLISNIKASVSKTNYSISIGYCYSIDSNKDIEKMVAKSDEMMYADKLAHYAKTGEKR